MPPRAGRYWMVHVAWPGPAGTSVHEPDGEAETAAVPNRPGPVANHITWPDGVRPELLRLVTVTWQSVSVFTGRVVGVQLLMASVVCSSASSDFAPAGPLRKPNDDVWMSSLAM